MLEPNPQFISTQAGDLVVLTRAKYNVIMELFDRDEDAEEMAIFHVRMADLASGSDTRLPPEVAGFMLKGDTLLRALRRWKGVTQSLVALKTGLAQGYISDIESGRKPGTPEVVRKIADAIEIDPQWLQPSP
jgi:DNA-binding XRE family transcriptional regulator